MKLLDVIKSSKVLSELNQCKDFSAVCAYRIAKNIDEINKELIDYSKQRDKLLIKYSDKDDNGQPIMIDNNGVQEYKMSNENRRKYVEELNDLHNEEVSLSLKKITLEQLGSIKMSPAELKTIEFMIDEE